MKKLSNTEAGLKKSVAYKKKRVAEKLAYLRGPYKAEKCGWRKWWYRVALTSTCFSLKTFGGSSDIDDDIDDLWK